ncbi:hypothetical protein EDD21DRAFT_359658 [Dissophora ornata]|nr:hypothetical protein EDD21DRAFT_359658 [Dissophora ornata]
MLVSPFFLSLALRQEIVPALTITSPFSATPVAALPTTTLLTATTTSHSPAWTWTIDTQNPFAPTPTLAPAPAPGGEVQPPASSGDQPTVAIYGLPTTLGIVALLMLIPCFFLWRCMRRKRDRKVCG